MKMRHRDLRNKINPTREFYTGKFVLVRKQEKSSRKSRIAQKFVFKRKVLYRVL